MAIGDIWRVAVSGAVGPNSEAPLGDHSKWVNVFHVETLSGVGTEAEEAFDIAITYQLMYADAGAIGLFGKGFVLLNVTTLNLDTVHSFEEDFTGFLGQESDRALPPQVSIALTGRNDVEGRRVTLYIAGINEVLLDDFGRLGTNAATDSLERWFSVKGELGFRFQPVIFDRDELLPTIRIDRWRMSPNFRTQRRRVLTATQPLVTVYAQVPG